MTKREPDLDRITTLLGQCLGRIDEQAYRLQQIDDEDDANLDVSDVLENEAATLQELVGSLMESENRSIEPTSIASSSRPCSPV